MKAVNFDLGTLFEGYSLRKDADLSPGQAISLYRRAQGDVSQEAFAGKFGVNLSTLRSWEQGQTTPPLYFFKYLQDYYAANSSIFVNIESVLEFYELTDPAFVSKKPDDLYLTEDDEDYRRNYDEDIHKYGTEGRKIRIKDALDRMELMGFGFPTDKNFIHVMEHPEDFEDSAMLRYNSAREIFQMLFVGSDCFREDQRREDSLYASIQELGSYYSKNISPEMLLGCMIAGFLEDIRHTLYKIKGSLEES